MDSPGIERSIPGFFFSGRPILSLAFDDSTPPTAGRLRLPCNAPSVRGVRFTPLRVVVLGSGSGGNAVVVESDGRRILIDAGFSCRELERRMRAVGIDPASIAALVLTHEHDDHVRGAGALRAQAPAAGLRDRGHDRGHRAAAGRRRPRSRRSSRAGRSRSAGFAVEPFLIPHDAREPVGFVVEDRQRAPRRPGRRPRLPQPARLGAARRSRPPAARDQPRPRDAAERPLPVAAQAARRRRGTATCRTSTPATDCPSCSPTRLRSVVLYHLSRTNNRRRSPPRPWARRSTAPARRPASSSPSSFEPTPWLEVTS